MAVTCGLAALSAFMLTYCLLSSVWMSLVCVTSTERETRTDAMGNTVDSYKGPLSEGVIPWVACASSCCLAAVAAVASLRMC
jgi:hypothetical protein